MGRGMEMTVPTSQAVGNLLGLENIVYFKLTKAKLTMHLGASPENLAPLNNSSIHLPQQLPEGGRGDEGA